MHNLYNFHDICYIKSYPACLAYLILTAHIKKFSITSNHSSSSYADRLTGECMVGLGDGARSVVIAEVVDADDCRDKC